MLVVYIANRSIKNYLHALLFDESLKLELVFISGVHGSFPLHMPGPFQPQCQLNKFHRILGKLFVFFPTGQSHLV